ncbi:MAG: hypothetical protein ILP11_04340 [Alphaproteobacteria bacterium]|nr:hypothetical protein [Alphaproteobacteria bacterium]
MDTYTQDYQVTSCACDAKGALRLRRLLNLFQEVAETQAERLGFGLTYCTEHKVVWVASGYYLQITRMPALEEKIKITTWPSSVSMVTANREFVVTTETGEVLIKATSRWALIDALSERLVPLKKQLPDLVGTDERAIDSSFPKIHVPENAEGPKTTAFPVHTDDIDINRHVNNALYPSWCLDMTTRPAGDLQEIQVSFNAPAKQGDTIEITTYAAENEQVHILQKPETKETYAQVRFVWKNAQ